MLIGNIHGVAVVLVIGQIGKLLGLSISARDPLDRLVENIREFGEVSGATVAVAAVALAVTLAFRFFVPRVPGAMVVVCAIGASWAFDLAGHGVAVVGLIPSGLPRPTLPRPGFGDVAQLAPAALGVFLVSFAEEILTARAFAGRRHEPVRASRGLLAMGAANAAAGFTQGFSVGAAGSRTAVKDSHGVRTQISGVFRGRDDRLHPAFPDRAGAVGLSVVDTVRRSARPYDALLGFVDTLGRSADVSLHPSARITPGVVVYRLDDRLFFANANYVRGRIQEAIGVPRPRLAGWFSTRGRSHTSTRPGWRRSPTWPRSCGRAGITLVVARLRYRMRDEFELAGVTAAIGADRFYQSVERAVEAYDPEESRPRPFAWPGP